MSTRTYVVGAAVAVVLGGAATAFALSNLPRSNGHAELRKSERKERALVGLSELRVRAPYGTYVIEYALVPTESGLRIGGSSMTEAKLFGATSTFTNYLPDRGFDGDLPLETPVRVTPVFSNAAATRAPTSAEASRAGTWLLVTKDRSKYDRIASIAGALPM